MAKRYPPWERAELAEEVVFDQVAVGKAWCHRGLVGAEELGRAMNSPAKAQDEGVP